MTSSPARAEPADDAAPGAHDFRAEVARLRAAESARVFPLGVHLGRPPGPRSRLELPWRVDEAIDQGLRFDLAATLADGLATRPPMGGPVWGWVTRPGVPEVHDRDLGWLAAVVRAAEAHDLPLAGFRAVTRTGWLDLLSGETQSWGSLSR